MCCKLASKITESKGRGCLYTCLCCLPLQSWLRVSQQLHTMSQVVVGAAIGTIFSILWYWTWNAVVHEAYSSYFWVRLVVVLGAAGFCIGFLLYVIRYWIRDER